MAAAPDTVVELGVVQVAPVVVEVAAVLQQSVQVEGIHCKQLQYMWRAHLGKQHEAGDKMHNLQLEIKKKTLKIY